MQQLNHAGQLNIDIVSCFFSSVTMFQQITNRLKTKNNNL
jgi:hypothetical protein